MKRIVKALAAAAMAVVVAAALTGCSGVEITQVGLPSEASVKKGDTLQLEISYGADKEATAEKIAEAAEKLTFEWTTSDEEVAAVDQAGVITAVAAGEADITVSVKDANIQSVCHVKVTVPLEEVTAPEKLELAVNGTESAELEIQLTPEDATDVTLSYTSSDESVATVDENGIVTAKGNGECVVTTKATVPAPEDSAVGTQEWAAQTQVTVKTLPTEILLDSSSGSLKVGGTHSVKVTLVPDEAVEAHITWTSSDESVAMVSEDGLVAAVAAGTAVITAKVDDTSLEATYTVTVTKNSGTKTTTSTGSASSNSGTSSGAGGSSTVTPPANNTSGGGNTGTTTPPSDAGSSGAGGGTSTPPADTGGSGSGSESGSSGGSDDGWNMNDSMGSPTPGGTPDDEYVPRG